MECNESVLPQIPPCLAFAGGCAAPPGGLGLVLLMGLKGHPYNICWMLGEQAHLTFVLTPLKNDFDSLSILFQ